MDSPRAIYERAMYAKRYGIPNYHPDCNVNFVPEIRERGTSVGDVGYFKDGIFHYLFNITLPADHAVNVERVPVNFIPVEFRETVDVYSDSNYYPIPSVTYTASVTNCELGGSAGVESPVVNGIAGANFRVKFTRGDSEGAILVLPDGGSRHDMLPMRRLKNYIEKHAESWFTFLEKDHETPELFLVTGCDKTSSWGIATFSEASGTYETSLQFQATAIGELSGSLRYSWTATSSTDCRTGPGTSNQFGKDCQNQCIFIRGMRISLRRDSRMSRLLGSVKIMDETDPSKPATKSIFESSGNRRVTAPSSSSFFGLSMRRSSYRPLLPDTSPQRAQIVYRSKAKSREENAPMVGDFSEESSDETILRNFMINGRSVNNDAAQEMSLRRQLDDLGNPSKWADSSESFLRQLRRLRDLADLSECIELAEHNLLLTPDGPSDDISQLSSLGNLLLTRFEWQGDIVDLNRSIEVYENVVRFSPESHLDKPFRQNDLGCSLLARFQRLGDVTDLNRSISVYEEAIHSIPDDHLDRVLLLNNLGNSLLVRFERLGDIIDLNRSIQVHEAAIAFSPGLPDEIYQSHNLVNSLLSRFRRLGDVSDLNEAIRVQAHALASTTSDSPNKALQLTTFGNSLLLRFEHTGGLSDLRESIQAHEEALVLTPDGDPKKAFLLNNLANALLAQFNQLGDVIVLCEAHHLYEQVLKLIPDGHPDKASHLNNLGNVLMARFQHLGDVFDLSEALRIYEEAIEHTPQDHPREAFQLNNLGCSLLARFELLGNSDDLNRSIQAIEYALELSPESHPLRSLQFHNLDSSLRRRFEQHQAIPDLNRLIEVRKNAVQLIPDGHPDKLSTAINLRNSLLCRFQKLGDPVDLQESIRAMEIAIRAALQHEQSPISNMAIHSCTSSMRLTLELTRDGLSSNKVPRQIQELSKVAWDAVTRAITAGKYETAIEYLEYTRIAVGELQPWLLSSRNVPRQVHIDVDIQLQILSSSLERSPTLFAYLQKSPAVRQCFHIPTRYKLHETERGSFGFGASLLEVVSRLLSTAEGGPMMTSSEGTRGVMYGRAMTVSVLTPLGGHTRQQGAYQSLSETVLYFLRRPDAIETWLSSIDGLMGYSNSARRFLLPLFGGRTVVFQSISEVLKLLAWIYSACHKDYRLNGQYENPEIIIPRLVLPNVNLIESLLENDPSAFVSACKTLAGWGGIIVGKGGAIRSSPSLAAKFDLTKVDQSLLRETIPVGNSVRSPLSYAVPLSVAPSASRSLSITIFTEPACQPPQPFLTISPARQNVRIRVHATNKPYVTVSDVLQQVFNQLRIHRAQKSREDITPLHAQEKVGTEAGGKNRPPLSSIAETQGVHVVKNTSAKEVDAECKTPNHKSKPS